MSKKIALTDYTRPNSNSPTTNLSYALHTLNALKQSKGELLSVAPAVADYSIEDHATARAQWKAHYENIKSAIDFVQAHIDHARTHLKNTTKENA